MIGRLQNGNDRQRREALENIATTYRAPVYARLRRMGHRCEEASDLTQAFFAEVVLGRGLLDGAAPEKGLLRSLILKALKRFDIDKLRRRASRPDVTAAALNGLEYEETIFAESLSTEPDEEFDRRWALLMLQHALDECERHFRDSGKARNWEVFAARVVLPFRGSCRPAPLDQLADELGFRHAADAAQAVQTVKLRTQAILKEIVASTTSGASEEAELEYREVLRLLGWKG
jgi:DNA-directed RNA polymerase specialized sigma24 family protein